ncbi:MAG: dihydrodipicolinate reductase [Pseudomonadota bacterium]|nr:dihydrodipicolinate reductase [Pseudomonadota bacterium]
MQKAFTKKRKIRVVQYGLGYIGLETVRAILKKETLAIVGAVDTNPRLAGKDLGELLKLPAPLGVKVSDRPRELLADIKADVAIHTTSSRIPSIYQQFEDILENRINIVSASEELLFPSAENAILAERIHLLATEKRVTVLGTGVNPGFVMDALPLFLTGVCQEVREIHVRRVVDAATRRYALQRKIGAGMTVEGFQREIDKKALGHVGLRESLHLIIDKLGRSVDLVEESVAPVIATHPIRTDYFEIKPGDVAGIEHLAKGIKDGKEFLTLELRMYVGAPDPHDAIRIVGTPDISLTIEGGVAGDQATAAVLVNSIPAVLDAKPGLITVKDLPSPYCY